jgi:hypothetical protein
MCSTEKKEEERRIVPAEVTTCGYTHAGMAL